MSLSIQEMTTLPFFQFLHLEVGHQGIQNKIEAMGILEYEYEKGAHPKRKFDPNSLVITSLYFAKNNPEILTETLRLLYRDGVSGLIVKKIFFNELPAELLEYAEELGFPIFSYGKEEPVHFEDILLALKQAISFEESQQMAEKQLADFLFQRQSFTEDDIQQIFFQDQTAKMYQICYLLPNDSKATYHHWLNLFKTIEHPNVFTQAIKYKSGIFLILGQKNNASHPSLSSLENIFQQTGIAINQFRIGCSQVFQQLSFMKQALEEALTSAEYSQLFDQTLTRYEELGLYQLILPFYKETVFIEYSQQLLLKIKKADPSKKQKLLKTARVFVQEEGDIKRIAEVLAIHENSVRYRLQKIAAIVNQQSAATAFPLYEQLSIAFKIEELRQKKTET